MTRLQRILIAILAAQVVLTAIVFWPRANASAVAKPLLGDLKAADIAALTITDDKGTTIRLVKQGDSWVLPDADNFPADAAKITPALDKLVALKVGQPIAQTAGSHKQLSVAADSFQRKVELSTAAGAGKTFFIGTGSGSQSSHVRLDGQNEVYLANGLAAWEMSAETTSWVDIAYVKSDAATVQGFSLATGNGQWSFSKNAAGAWSLDGLAPSEQAAADKINSLLSQAIALNLTRPLGKTEAATYGLAKPSALVTVKTKSSDVEKTYTLTVGAKDATDSSYVVKLSESPYYVRVAGYSVQDLVDAKRESLLQAPPTPTPQK